MLLHALNDETRPQAVALFNKILNLTHSVTRSPSYRGKSAYMHEFVLFPDESEPFALSAPCLREGVVPWVTLDLRVAHLRPWIARRWRSPVRDLTGPG